MAIALNVLNQNLQDKITFGNACIFGNRRRKDRPPRAGEDLLLAQRLSSRYQWTRIGRRPNRTASPPGVPDSERGRVCGAGQHRRAAAPQYWLAPFPRAKPLGQFRQNADYLRYKVGETGRLAGHLNDHEHRGCTPDGSGQASFVALGVRPGVLRFSPNEHLPTPISMRLPSMVCTNQRPEGE